jgi:hypothetical protein
MGYCHHQLLQLLPKRSTIVFAGFPPHVYQFPCNSTLLEIRDILKIRKGMEELENDPYIERIVGIMKVREEKGIYLPGNVSDERITIGIPDINTSTYLDREAKITAWQVADEEVRGLKKIVKNLKIESNVAQSPSITSAQSASSEGGKDYYQDVGDLINSLNDSVDTDDESGWPRSCICQACSSYGSELHQNILNSQSQHVVPVRGGGSDPEYWNHDQHGIREFPLHYPKLPIAVNAPQGTLKDQGKIAPASHRIAEDKAIAMSKGPLSMRLGRLIFPPMFMQQRESSIRRFDWQHSKRLSPQYKDKSSRGFRYTRSAHCEDWVTHLDKHREYCDYCQAVFTEEDYAPRNLIPRHEDDAPALKSGAGRSWNKSTWPENTNNPPFSTVEDPDPRLRGGASSEADLDNDSKDWRSEWDDLASQIQSASCQPRTIRNSSTLSTKTTILPSSPVYRGSKPRRWPRRSELCTAMEFIKDGPTILKYESCKSNAPRVRAGESVLSPHYYRPTNPNHMIRSKASHPFLLETRRSRGGSVLERPYTGYKNFQHESSLGVSVVESDNILDLRAENWLENPRPTPSPPCIRHSESSSQYSQQSHDIGLTKVFDSDCCILFDAKPRKSSFRSDRHEFFPATRHSDLPGRRLRTRGLTIPSGMPLSRVLSGEMYEEHVRSRPVKKTKPSSPQPRWGVKLCERCTELLTLIVQYLNRLGQRLAAKRPKKRSSRSTIETPAAPPPSRTGREAWYMNRRLPPVPFDKSLPPTPHASNSGFNLHPEPKEKFPATPSVSASLIECAQAIAQAHDRAHADSISQQGDDWHVPTVAGPSDLVKEALMWLRHEAQSSNIGKVAFDRSMRDDITYDYVQSNG